MGLLAGKAGGKHGVVARNLGEMDGKGITPGGQAQGIG
jgi:hypothetical protein